jgi:hypothetical protein
MAFFGMFRSRAERDVELRVRVRQGHHRIQKFVAKMEKQSAEYAVLARRAFDLDDQTQFRMLASGFLQCRDAVNRWERYLVRLKTLELRRAEGEATRDFLSSMNAMTASILQGVSPDDVATLQHDMQLAMEKSAALEDALATAVEETVSAADAELVMDGPSLNAVTAAIGSAVATGPSIAGRTAISESPLAPGASGRDSRRTAKAGNDAAFGQQTAWRTESHSGADRDSAFQAALEQEIHRLRAVT